MCGRIDVSCCDVMFFQCPRHVINIHELCDSPADGNVYKDMKDVKGWNTNVSSVSLSHARKE